MKGRGRAGRRLADARAVNSGAVKLRAGCTFLLLAAALAGAPAAAAGAGTPISSEPVAPVTSPTSGTQPPEAPGPPTAPLSPVALSIDTLHPAPRVPRRFLGLSFEAAAIPQLSGYAHRGNLVALLRSLGPGTLRFGGVSSDQNVGWTDSATPPPAWASSTINPREIAGIGELARRSGWNVMLTVGIAHFEPQAAAREVASARRALGPLLAAVEIGNEPDAYAKHGFREPPWVAQGYEEQVSIYREAIDAAAPGVPLAGPDVTGSGAFQEWGEEEALAQQPALLTGHHYPLGCAQSPTDETLLSEYTRSREARSLDIYRAIGALRGIPVRIDETNSVSCGGVAGISNTFAGTLWATGYIAQAMDAGVVGLNFHGIPTSCLGYAPFCMRDAAAQQAGALSAQPDWYALLLGHSLVGSRPLRTGISTAANLLAAAFLSAHGAQQIVLVDYEPPGSAPLTVEIPVAAVGRAAVERLLAPSPTSAAVTLGGRRVTAAGLLAGAPRAERVRVRAGTVTVTLAPSSAALVDVPAAVKARSRRPGH